MNAVLDSSLNSLNKTKPGQVGQIHTEKEHFELDFVHAIAQSIRRKASTRADESRPQSKLCAAAEEEL